MHREAQGRGEREVERHRERQRQIWRDTETGQERCGETKGETDREIGRDRCGETQGETETGMGGRGYDGWGAEWGSRTVTGWARVSGPLLPTGHVHCQIESLSWLLAAAVWSRWFFQALLPL